MTMQHSYIMRDQVKNRVGAFMDHPAPAASRLGWMTPPSVLSALAVVLYITALSAAG